MYVYEAHFSLGTRLSLKDLQKKLKRGLDDDAKKVDNLHCTIWFQGDIERLISSLLGSNIVFNRKTLEKNFKQMLKLFARQSVDIVTNPTDLCFYGPNADVLALEVQKPLGLQELHAQAYQYFIDLLKTVGLSGAEINDLQHDPSWRWIFGRQYKPHISLYKNASMDDYELSEVLLPSEIVFNHVVLVEYGKKSAPVEVR